jgi:hypothetical protein
MKLELLGHLDKARDAVNQVDRIISSHQYPGDTRTVLVMGLLSTIIQHHRGMLLLIKSANVGSAYALTRDIVKGMRYGLWINCCATEDQILRVQEEEEFPFSIPDLIREIQAAYSTDPFFENLKNSWATQLYKYTRSDIFHVGRWHINSSSGLDHDDAEIRDVTTIATLSIVVLAAKFLDRQNYGMDCKQVEGLAELGLSASQG